MTEFVDGPAAGQVLMLRRAPLFLRVTVNRYGREKYWDALDQLDDTPVPGEDLIAYRKVEDRGTVHLCRSPRRLSGWFAIAKYALIEPQPADRVMRITSAWRTWCLTLAEAEKS
jgi:hypothetical protein